MYDDSDFDTQEEDDFVGTLKDGIKLNGSYGNIISSRIDGANDVGIQN